MLKATRLHCEHQENPIGIGERRPRFSWILESDGRGVMQEGYRLQVAAGGGFSSLLWDSGDVRSGASVLVDYAGPELPSSARRAWRVMVRDNHGEESTWSDEAFFETGLLDPSSWKARFISPEDENAGASSAGMLVRKEFTLADDVAFARVYATALGMYELSINGQRVGDALFTPGWTSYSKRLLYQTWDVTNVLRHGANAIAATLGCGWYKGDLAGWLGRRNVYGTRTALLAQVLVRYTDGREELIVTDDSWKSSAGPVVYSELYNGETYDARLERRGYDQPGYDDSGWHKVWLLPDRGPDVLQAQDGSLVRRQERIAPLRMFRTPRGETVLDFGQNMAGWVRFSVQGSAGAKVVLKHAEVLDAAGNFYTENLRGARARVEYVLKGGGRETFEPHFTFQGFRYVMVEEYPGEPVMQDFEAVVIHTDLEPAGTFSCSHELINKLHRNILWSLKGNFVDIPTDCPQRDERLGWTGDAQVFIGTALFLVQAAPFYRKWLRDLRADQGEGGGVPHVVPDVLSGALNNDSMITAAHSSTGWGDAAVIVPWALYERCADLRILGEQYDSMKGWVEYIRAHAEDGVLWNTGFHFGDWVALDAKEGSYFGATPNDLTATAFYANSAGILSRASALLGRRREAADYAQLHRRIVDAFRREFFTPSGRLAARTQTAHILALAFDLAPPEHRKRTTDTLVRLIEENGGHLTTGFLGTPFACRVLADNGQLGTAYALLLKEDYPSWLYEVTKGATTIWEHWDGIKPDGSMWSPSMNSFNHYAYGAIGEWLHQAVAGLAVQVDERGRHRVAVRPRPGGGLTYARAGLMTPFGQAAVSWKLDPRGRLAVEVLVPHNTTATVMLPGATRARLGRQGAQFRDGAGGAHAVLGSGSSLFEYEPSV
jgi:alpha-L-rhamnosidase